MTKGNFKATVWLIGSEDERVELQGFNYWEIEHGTLQFHFSDKHICFVLTAISGWESSAWDGVS